MNSVIVVSCDFFLDRPAVVDAMDQATREVMQEAGQILRKDARDSMPRAPLNVHAPPGTPPHRHAKSKRNPSGGGLWRSIMYAYDPMAEVLVVGPSVVVGMNIAKVAQRHEFGDSAAAVKNPRRTQRRLGEVGEIRTGGRRGGKIARKTLRGRVRVHYAPLETPSQVRRATAIQEELYGPEHLQATYPERRFMGPALERKARELPAEYHGLVG